MSRGMVPNKALRPTRAASWLRLSPAMEASVASLSCCLVAPLNSGVLPSSLVSCILMLDRIFTHPCPTWRCSRPPDKSLAPHKHRWPAAAELWRWAVNGMFVRSVAFVAEFCECRGLMVLACSDQHRKLESRSAVAAGVWPPSLAYSGSLSRGGGW